MRKYLVLLFLLIPLWAYGATGDAETVIGKTDTTITTILGKTGTGIASVLGKNYTDGDAGVTTSCIGYPDHGTDCDYTTAPGGQSSVGADATRARIWTASVNGTVSRVKVYFTACGTDNVFTIGYWNGTQLRGTATITCSASAWVWSGDFAAYSGRSLSFSSSDTVYFGVSVDYGSGTTGIGRDNETTNYSYYSGAAYLPDPHSLSSNTNYEMALILEYDH